MELTLILSVAILAFYIGYNSDTINGPEIQAGQAFLVFVGGHCFFWMCMTTCLMLCWMITGFIVPRLKVENWARFDTTLRQLNTMLGNRIMSLLKKHYLALITWVILGELGLFERYPQADEYLWAVYAVWRESD